MSCNICKKPSSAPICLGCEIALFLVDDILNEYMTGSAPQWMVDGVREFDFLFRVDPRARAYFNVAAEVAERIIFDGEMVIDPKTLVELEMTRIPSDEIYDILARTQLVKMEGQQLSAGPLAEKLLQMWLSLGREEMERLEKTEMREILQEIYGVVSAAVLKALFDRASGGEIRFIPRSALAVIKILSEHIDEHIHNEHIPRSVSKDAIKNAFRRIPRKQIRRIKRRMTGINFEDPGSPRVISDVRDDGRPILKGRIIPFLEHERDRFRERLRELGRE